MQGVILPLDVGVGWELNSIGCCASDAISVRNNSFTLLSLEGPMSSVRPAFGEPPLGREVWFLA